jgi:MFS family permease
VTRDARLLFLARAVRMSGYGALGVILVLYLAAAGLDAGQIGVLLTLTLYLQLSLGFSAIHAGFTLAPWSLGMAVGAGVGGGMLAPRFGRRVLHAGLLVMLVGVVALLAVIDAQGADLTTLALAAPAFVCGLGSGAIVAPVFAVVLAAVEDHEVGSASGVLSALQQLGAAIGVAVLGTVFFGAVAGDGFATAIERVLWVEAGVLVATAALAFALPREARDELAH